MAALALCQRIGRRRVGGALAGCVAHAGRRWQATEVDLATAPSASAAPAAAKPSASAVDSASKPSSLEPAPEAGVPAVPAEPKGVGGISYRGPISEDVEGGARYSDSIAKIWSNIPNHVRASFKAPASLSDAPKVAAPLLLDQLTDQAKQLVVSTGLAPTHWARGGIAQYYGGRIDLAPYRKGQTAAYNYPKFLVPREVANRFPLDMYVDPVFQTSDPGQKFRAKAMTLFPKLQNKTTLLFVFSGQPLSGLWTGLRQWTDLVAEEFLARKSTQMLRLHYEEGWWNRRTHVLTKFHLRRQVEEDELFSTFVYRGKWKYEYAHALHLYDKSLPVVLLIDPLGYIRWHAVGLPSEEATEVFRSLSKKLATEKRNYV